MIGALTATFFTAGVEWVEAYTIVLAVALSIGWGQALRAGAAALATLAVFTAVASILLIHVRNLALLQFIIGVLLVLFGLRWLAKAIARSSGRRALHDEDLIFSRLRAREDIHENRAAWWIAFNGVLLEGLEVWLIVVAFGVQTHHTAAATGAALLALLTVALAGAAVRKPLAKVPENTIKFTTGAGILAFGTFWVLEALGYAWPLGEITLLALFAFYIAGGLAAIRISRPAAG